MSDSEKPAAPAADKKPATSTLEADLTKYKTAADVVNNVMKKLIELSVEGAKVIDICTEGDKLIEQGIGAVYNKPIKGVRVSKGIAFPTCVSVNNTVSHFSPLACVAFLFPFPSRVLFCGAKQQWKEFKESDLKKTDLLLVFYSSDSQSSQTLAKDDVVKLHIGAHIDGFASVSAETIIVGASAENPVTGRRADVIKAAWTAAEIAMRTVKAGNKNWAVTEAVGRVAAAWDCKPVEGMLSCQQTQNVIDGKKRIILNPSEAQKKEFEAVTFAEGEVWGIDILVSTGEDGKARAEESRTTIYQRDSTITYQLKMKTSRAVFSEVQKKAGAFPFNIRVLEDEKRARMGLQEAVQHSLVKPYDVV
ncbi:Creatinase/aminopeptidase [Dendrothele bispora CBS 962.96]|uniref:Creatinase/aminopeptidase n=1 Tax=Dendrothele bispora (strain CBS 962.96) TaxID=1314807 RepID=A0A4S8MW17_DENBC|nr:Creatinase/aminopeptidase [Dendrothele bispora CBS 962.96]